MLYLRVPPQTAGEVFILNVYSPTYPLSVQNVNLIVLKWVTFVIIKVRYIVIQKTQQISLREHKVTIEKKNLDRFGSNNMN